MKSITIIGLGWLGEACASYFSKKGYEVKGTKRNQEIEQAYPVYPWRLGDDFPEQALSECVLISIAAKNIQADEFDKLFSDLKKSGVSQIIFTSSTSVYNGLTGPLTEELSLMKNDSNANQILIVELLLKHFPDAVVLRLGGLVGPGRHPARFLSGKKNLANPLQKTNLVHQQDVIQMIEQCVLKQATGVFNVCSSVHSTRKEFYTKVCEFNKMPLPEFVEEQEEEIRWVSNEKSKKQLSYQYLYDDLLLHYLRSELKA